MEEKFDPRCHIGEVHGVYTIVDMLDEKINMGIGDTNVSVVNVALKNFSLWRN